jgi:hypothetical protein
MSDQTTGSQAGDTREAAKQEASRVQEQARDEATNVAQTAQEQASRVTDEARTQARNLASEARQQVRRQAQDQTDRLGSALRQLSKQAEAVLDGRPDDAGQLGSWMRDATGQINRLADQVDDLGFEGVVGELRDFARRRPGAFLLGAATAGFVVARLGRGARDAQRSGGTAQLSRGTQALPTRTPSTQSVGTTTPTEPFDTLAPTEPLGTFPTEPPTAPSFDRPETGGAFQVPREGIDRPVDLGEPPRSGDITPNADPVEDPDPTGWETRP